MPKREELFVTSEKRESSSAEATKSYNNLDECVTESIYSIRTILGNPPKKKRKTDNVCPMTFGEMQTSLNKPESRPIRILLDSGASKSIVFAELARKLHKTKSGTTQWSTVAGAVNTSHKARVKFKLSEFSTRKVIEWKFHVTKADFNYDMIIGRDLLKELNPPGVEPDF